MAQDYGLWPFGVINNLLLIVFADSFFHPRSHQKGLAWHPDQAGIGSNPVPTAATTGR